MSSKPINLVSPVLSSYFNLSNLLRTRKDLLIEITKREMTERYVGQFLGIAWAVINPLLVITVYIFVFSYIFKPRTDLFQSRADYIVFFLAGMIPWLSCQELMNRASMVIVHNANLVKQIVFPVEVLPIKIVLASLITQLISSIFMFSYIWLTQGFLLSHLAFPLLLLVQFLFMMGISYILSSIGVFFKDIKDIVTFFCSLNIFLSPILYSEEGLPKLLQYVLYSNPFSYLAWSYQDLLYYGHIQHPMAVLIFCIMSLAIFSIGYHVFNNLKAGFGDCL